MHILQCHPASDKLEFTCEVCNISIRDYKYSWRYTAIISNRLIAANRLLSLSQDLQLFQLWHMVATVLMHSLKLQHIMVTVNQSLT
jgi:hypothetical protein